MKVSKRVMAVMATAGLISLAAFLPARAEPVALDPDTDMTYSGILGETPVGETAEDAGAQGATSPVVMLEPGKSGHDRNSGKFVNYVGENMEFSYYTNVPNGIITNNSVSIELAEGSDWTLYKDGEQVTDASIGFIEDQGAYTLSVQNSSGAQSSFSFSIIHSVTNQLNTFDVPAGFQLTDVTLDGEGITLNSLNRQNLIKDGRYVVSFTCQDIGVSYTTTVLLDREPPHLALSNVKDGVASGEVSLEDLSPDDTLEVTLNGEPYEVSFMRKLTEHGNYHVKVTDPAGNSVTYVFTIQMYLTISSVMVFILVGLLIALLIAYGIHVRKHVRIR